MYSCLHGTVGPRARKGDLFHTTNGSRVNSSLFHCFFQFRPFFCSIAEASFCPHPVCKEAMKTLEVQACFSPHVHFARFTPATAATAMSVQTEQSFVGQAPCCGPRGALTRRSTRTGKHIRLTRPLRPCSHSRRDQSRILVSPSRRTRTVVET